MIIVLSRLAADTYIPSQHTLYGMHLSQKSTLENFDREAKRGREMDFEAEINRKEWFDSKLREPSSSLSIVLSNAT